ncbi:uncharacterized protein LOC126966949 [Leptidea sinapis]|uniref:uncharacterized protein LOC126966949 n=1 Tax=Leptidea sinapis TaxID=189913 RepID=UPI00213E3F33|nr:uncharacterized protein LOC126966949 [Leptidea sinapis]
MYLARVISVLIRNNSTAQNSQTITPKFEHVFAFPYIRNLALINRLKIYHFVGSCVIIPTCGVMETLNAVAESSFVTSVLIGVTGGAVLSLASLPFKNVIGHIFISEDNKSIKISSLDFYGRKIDRIIRSEEWIPILDLKPKNTDVLFLTPKLTDGTVYKLPVRFGIVKNQKKMSEVLE